MRYSDLKDKTKEELSHNLIDLRAKILKLNFDLADNKVKDFSQVKKTKRDVARVLTALKNLKS